jgi:RNA polymerase sigma factor (sigma-70 family)
MTTASPDCELVKAYATEGSETAFRVLVARHVNLVYATALRQVGDPGIAEEVSQNVFVVLARKAPRLGGTQTLAGWLHRTTILEAKARIRAELRRRRRDEAAAELAAVAREGEPALDALVPLLDEGLLNLRENDRVALVLRYFEDRSLRDVGAELGVDEDAARKRVSRALDRLTEFFKAKGFVIGGAAAVLSCAAAQASAPAGLAVSAGTAGLAAGGTVSAFKLILFRIMSLTKTQTAVGCVLLAATPLALQWRAEARIEREQKTVLSQIAEAKKSVSNLEGETRQARQSTLQAQNEAFNLQTRLTTVTAQISGRSPRPVYRWDDNSPFVRVPKQFLEMLPVSAVSTRRGQLSEQIKEVLQLTETETAQVQETVNQFLKDYYAAQAPRMTVATPNAEELQGHAADEVLTLEVSSVASQLPELRRALFERAEGILGKDRFALFQKALRNWMPFDEEYHGLNSGMAVLNFDRRETFYQPQPGSGQIGYRLGEKTHGTMWYEFQAEDIPELYQPYLKDWIALAQSHPKKEGNSEK